MSGCTLQLSRYSAVRTTLIDEATGQVKYKIDTPIRLTGSVTKIRKLESDTQPPHDWDEESDSDSDNDITDKKKKEKSKSEKEDGIETDTELPDLPETSDEMARIYWHWFSSERIVFQGKITARNEFLPSCGKLIRSFTFTGPDGVQYRWILGAMEWNYPKLVTADEEKKVIAEFHCTHYITGKVKAKLEVQPAGMHMLDYIVLTFVVVEEKRTERKVKVRFKEC